MADDLVRILTTFHREVFLPDFKRVIAEAFEEAECRLSDQFQKRFDALAQQLDRFGR